MNRRVANKVFYAGCRGHYPRYKKSTLTKAARRVMGLDYRTKSILGTYRFVSDFSLKLASRK